MKFYKKLQSCWQEYNARQGVKRNELNREKEELRYGIGCNVLSLIVLNEVAREEGLEKYVECAPLIYIAWYITARLPGIKTKGLEGYEKENLARRSTH